MHAGSSRLKQQKVGSKIDRSHVKTLFDGKSKGCAAHGGGCLSSKYGGMELVPHKNQHHKLSGKPQTASHAAEKRCV